MSSRLATALPVLLASAAISFASAARAEGSEPRSDGAGEAPRDSIGGPDWLLLVTPTCGWLRNTTKFKFEVPSGRDADGEYVFREDHATMTDDTWGGGFVLMGFYRRVALTSVFFGFPDVNQSDLLGNITYLSGSIPTGIPVEPYLGLGFVAVGTDTDYDDFRYRREDDFSTVDESGHQVDVPAVGYAHFPRISVDNRVLAPFPKVGLKVAIPLQHWYVLPFYSYMFEDVRTRARSDGGLVEVYAAEGPQSADTGGSPLLEIDIDAFDSTLNKRYHSHLVGANFFLDFHYFLQLRGKVYYNTSHDLWTVRLIGSLLFHRNMGLTAYFEYSQKITVTNTYFLVGPAFLFSPPGWMDEMTARRERADGEER